MKHRELTDHIKGSFLKRQYLEAFLVQSAYIESLLKLFADFRFFEATNTSGSSRPKILTATEKTIERMGLNELINFLHKSELLSKTQKDLLNTYRERRNKMLHDLIKEIRKPEFDAELREICEKGTAIVEGKEFIEMAELVDYLEGPPKNSEPKKPPTIPEINSGVPEHS